MHAVGPWILYQLSRPIRIFFACLIFASFSLILNQSFVNLFSLKRDHLRVYQQITAEQFKINELDSKLKKARDPSYIERQALDKLDMAEEHDLVFVFSDE